MISFPKQIMDVVGSQKYTMNNIGMSDSDVLIYPEYVLKIQSRNVETDNEADVAAWLNGRIPVPRIAAYCVEDDRAYTLMTRVFGKMLCDKEYINEPARLIRLAAEGIRLLWEVSIDGCPLEASRLESRLREARRRVENGLVDIDNTEPETFGDGGFKDPTELLIWLEQNRPEEELVFTHGDLCLPNVFCDEHGISGFIDLGKMGPADRWQDLAILMRSLKSNFAGRYGRVKTHFDFEPQMLLDELGITMDKEKFMYYILLDELF